MESCQKRRILPAERLCVMCHTNIATEADYCKPCLDVETASIDDEDLEAAAEFFERVVQGASWEEFAPDDGNLRKWIAESRSPENDGSDETKWRNRTFMAAMELVRVRKVMRTQTALAGQKERRLLQLLDQIKKEVTLWNSNSDGGGQ